MPLQSFCVQLEDVKNESGNVFQQLYRSFKILQDTLCFSTLLVVMSVHLIGMCGYGIAYLRSCPMEPNIPLYLVVGGLSGLYKVLLLFFDESKMRHDDYHKSTTANSSGRSAATSALHKILDVFLVVWFFFGNVWILRHLGFWTGQLTADGSGGRGNKDDGGGAGDGMLKLASLCEMKIYTFALTHLVFVYVLIAAAILYAVVVLLVTRK